jgi:SAM-dependent methyltransferase
MSRRDAWNERYAAQELIWSAEPNRLFAEQVQSLKSGTALDVACGEGRNALWLAEQGWMVTAIDFSDVAIDKARRIAEERGISVNWIADDVSEHPLAKRAFDLVSVLYLHTNSAERARWLPRVIDAVAPGGTFLYIGHDPSNIEHGVGGPQKPELLPGADDLRQRLDDFEIVAAEVVERPVDADPGHGRDLAGIALDTLVRAVRRQP